MADSGNKAVNAHQSVSFWHYFRSPFPKAEGFSAYRMPGLVVHLPVIIFFLWLGAWITLGDPWLYPLFSFYLILGIYLGRDLAILAHYSILITLGVIGGGMFLLSHPTLPPRPLPLAAAAITGAIGILFTIYVSWFIESESDAPGAPPSPNSEFAPSRFPVLNRVIDRIDHAAARDSDPSPVRLRKTLLIFLCSTSILLAPWVARHLWSLSLPLASQAALGYALLSLATLVLLMLTRRVRVAAALQLVGLFTAPALIQWEMGGFAASGAIVLWSLLAPLCALVFFGTRWAIPWFAAFALLVLSVAARDIGDGVGAEVVILFCENILLVSCVAFIALRYFIVERDRAEAALASEQQRSEELLLNILPAEIAARLKGGQKSMADGYAEVSILFADIVGFTKLSASITPESLVELLNRLFSRFDTLCDRFGVEKIKTIGDAYMACAGLPLPREDHALAIANMALAMQEALEEHNREFGSELKLRIGINSGPVVAGVIGLKKFIYDLWGDTVNLASRMESTGLSGCIQVSAATEERLRTDFVLESRGLLDIKGLPATEAWLLVRRKTAP